jgi:hypothetical protein
MKHVQRETKRKQCRAENLKSRRTGKAKHAINVKYSSRGIPATRSRRKQKATRANTKWQKSVKRYQEIKEQMDWGHD